MKILPTDDSQVGKKTSGRLLSNMGLPLEINEADSFFSTIKGA